MGKKYTYWCLSPFIKPPIFFQFWLFHRWLSICFLNVFFFAKNKTHLSWSFTFGMFALEILWPIISNIESNLNVSFYPLSNMVDDLTDIIIRMMNMMAMTWHWDALTWPVFSGYSFHNRRVWGLQFVEFIQKKSKDEGRGSGITSQ